MINQPWLETCAQAGEFLYGVFPYAILKRMYELKESGEPREDMIKAVIDSPALLLDYMDDPFLPFAQLGYKEGGYFQPTIATKGTDLYRFFEKLEKQGNPYARMHMIGDEHSLLVRNQGDVEFYIPTATEIEELVNNGYIETPQMKALVKEGANDYGDNSMHDILQEMVLLLPDHIEGATSQNAVERLTEVYNQYLNKRNNGECIWVVLFNLGLASEFENGLYSSNSQCYNMLEEILRNGPQKGVFTIAWHDDLTLFTQKYPNTIGFFNKRIAFNMSDEEALNFANVSKDPSINKNNAVFFEMGHGKQKFRPYGTPSSDWINQIINKISIEDND